MTDDQDELEVPDFYDHDFECGARQQKPVVIGAPTHTHICREYPDHEQDHACHSCGYQWPRKRAAA